MVPSSIQWTMTPSVNILVYPISRYVISPPEKSSETTCKRRIESQKPTAGRHSRSTIHRSSRESHADRLPEYYDQPHYRRSQKHRRTLTHPKKRCLSHRQSDTRPRSEKFGRSLDTYTSMRSTHCQGKRGAKEQKEEQDEKDELEEGEEEEDDDYDGDDDDFDGDEYDELKLDREEKRDRKEKRDREKKREERKQLAITSDDVDVSGSDVPPSVTENGVMRCSANVVLLAHGNRSLHVLMIQRSRVTLITRTSAARYRHRLSSTTVVSYKLPGGKFSVIDNEQQDYYYKDGRNTCTCLDDQKWYSAAINHFINQLTTRVPATTTAGHDDDGAQFVLLGNWYRTRDDDSDGYNKTVQAGSNYYPYKPTHVSRRVADHKRVYAVPDACQLFPDAGPTFRLQTPRTKTKTAETATITVTYKCEFVPLARLHENSRMYGPVLSSLPAVLSGLNLICSP